MVDTKGRANHSSRKTIPPCSSWKVDNENALLGRTHDFSRSRRDIFTAVITATIPLLGTSLLPDGALAFDNRISTAYDDRPKRRGPQVCPFTNRMMEVFMTSHYYVTSTNSLSPTPFFCSAQPQDLGVKKRKGMSGEEYVGLKPCDAAPHCFCSSTTSEDAENDPMHTISPWVWPISLQGGKQEAFQQLITTIKSYPPGQSNVDGGGFQIVKEGDGYIYAQFESLKNGYIDDFEVAAVGDTNDDRTVQIRSSSRIGYLDFGVNAKRINWIAQELRKRGWDAPGVFLQDQHKDYASLNGLL